MRIRSPWVVWSRAVALLAISLCFSLRSAAVTFTVSPNTISNTYPGVVTLQISGLTNGEKVLVQRFYDLNGNGVVDSGDTLVQSFKVTDGQVAAIGGVTDPYIPGDNDGATNGQIQTSFSFLSSAELSRLAGNYVFVVSSPSGRFAPVTQAWTVTQTPYTQGVTGQVTSGGLPVPYAGISVLTQSGNNMQFVVGALTDSSGNFSLNCPPGSYALLAVESGYVYDFGSPAMVTVNPGLVVTQNVSLITATQTISGSVFDAVTSKGIPAFQFFLESATNKLTIAFSDTNGNLSIPVVADQWKMEISDFNINQSGYLRPQNKIQVDTSSGSVSGVSIPLSRATALIYGYVRDGSNAPLSGISMNANDSGNLYSVSGTTDTNGYYLCAVLGGSWFIGPSSDSGGLTNYTIQGTNTSVVDGQAVQVNFVASTVAGHLRGVIQDDHGNPIGNMTIVVQPYPVSGNGANSIYPQTDGSGNFDVGVAAGTWNIALECVSAQQRNLVNVENYNYTITDGVDQNGLVISFPVGTAMITGNITDTLGNPVANVGLDANGSNYNSGCIVTDLSGHFQLNVVNGTWNLSVRSMDLNALGYNSVINQSIPISGGNQSANFIVTPLTPSLSQPKVIAGQFQFNLNGFDARRYRLEFSTNFSSWITLGTNQTSSGVLHFIDTNSLSPIRRFYRAVVVH